MHTKKEVIIYNPDTSKGLEFYVDADFTAGWSQEVGNDSDIIFSGIRMVIMYYNCPVYWSSSLQTSISLITAEAEYIALSYALIEVLPVMKMMEEKWIIPSTYSQTKVFFQGPRR